MTVLDASFIKQTGYEKTAQFVYDLLTAKGLVRDKEIEFLISKDGIDISIIDGELQMEEARIIIMCAQVEVEIYQVCQYPKAVVEIAEQAQMFANFTTFD